MLDLPEASRSVPKGTGIRRIASKNRSRLTGVRTCWHIRSIYILTGSPLVAVDVGTDLEEKIMEIEIPKSLALTEEQIKRLSQELEAEVVDTLQGDQAQALTNAKEVEESEVVKVKRKAKVTT